MRASCKAGRLMRRTRLRSVSKRQQAKNRELARARKIIVERSGGLCEGDGFSDYCTGVGTDAHHVRTRSQGGTHDPENLRWLCHPCHMWIHDHPLSAREAGLLAAGCL